MGVETKYRPGADQSLAKMLETAEREFRAKKASGKASGRRGEIKKPCRFGVGRLLVITTLYAMLFAILRTGETHPLNFLAVVLFVTAVGLGQTLLFHGQRQRRASLIMGACMFAGIIAFSDWTGIGPPRRTLSFRVFPLEGAFIGAGCGYLVGRLIASVFSLINKLGCR